MKRVHLLTEEGSLSSIAFNFPLQLHRRRLRESGIDVQMFLAADGELFDCDVLFINSNFFGSVWRGLGDDVAAVLERGRRQTGKVVWFDTSASSGTAQFDVLSYVDLYAKAQVLADRAGYLKGHYGARIFTAYYHQTDGVREESNEEGPVPSREDLTKIRVSWSAALGDFGVRARRYRRFGRYLPFFRRYSAHFFPPDGPRRAAVACRIGLGHRRSSVLHHRRRIKEILERDFGLETQPVPRDVYLLELRNARIGVSPFGYGEVCFRDFEVILSGAALVKPDMSHLETWPPLYVDGVTYAAHGWDFQDLGEVLGDLLADDRWKEISFNAQSVYRRYLFDHGGHEEFCSRVRDLVLACS